MNDRITRRTWLRRAGAGALAAGAASLGLRGLAGAAEPAKLDVSDPAAVALGYVEDAASVDVRKHPSYAKGSSCANCMQLGGKEGDAYRPCTLFPGKLVAARGWCTGWAPEM